MAREGRYTEALRAFEEDLCFTQNPMAMSYYSLCLAKAEGNYDKAISLCLMAAEKEFYNPEIYLNLGRIFLLNGQKSVAVKAFRKGLSFDSTHNAILSEVRRLGVRRRPPVSFLSRASMVNRFLGMLTHRFA
jgi:tetratricopeptide (TPR) repeat protein